MLTLGIDAMFDVGIKFDLLGGARALPRLDPRPVVLRRRGRARRRGARDDRRGLAAARVGARARGLPRRGRHHAARE